MKQSDIEAQQLIICHECDALQVLPSLQAGVDASCVCCDSILLKNHASGIERPLALMFACLILFILSNVFPIIQLTIAGIESDATLTQAAVVFYQQGSPELALVVWLFSVLIPGVCILGLLYILLSIRYHLNWQYTKLFLVWISRLLPWGMMDVFLLAVLVAYVKLVALADVVLGIGFVAFVCLIFCYATALSFLELPLLWQSLDADNKEAQCYE